MSNTPQRVERDPAHQAEVDEACRRLALYEFAGCPFCRRVLSEIERLNLDIPLRDTQREPGAREALHKGGGRTTVPCLRIDHDSGEREWLYESSDIVAWLRRRFETQASDA